MLKTLWDALVTVYREHGWIAAAVLLVIAAAIVYVFRAELLPLLGG